MSEAKKQLEEYKRDLMNYKNQAEGSQRENKEQARFNREILTQLQASIRNLRLQISEELTLCVSKATNRYHLREIDINLGCIEYID